MNVNILKAKMIEKEISMEDMARMSGMSVSTLYRKLKADGEFSIKEASDIAKSLNLNYQDVMKIFFDHFVA